MNKEQVKKTLAYNLKFLRKERELSQAALAKAAGLSFRLVQEIEAGKGNPTIESITSLARAFRCTAMRLLTLSHLRILESDTKFIACFKKEFQSASICVSLRNLDGVALWVNERTRKLLGAQRIENDEPFEIAELFTEESRGILRMQLNAERRGIVNPYSIFYVNPTTRERYYLRCYPTLILPRTGRAAIFSSVFVTEIDRECEENYYEYCRALFNCVRDD